ncbi:MAG: hypothetical protein V7767_03175 [Leeuwenhoekiella sp.]
MEHINIIYRNDFGIAFYWNAEGIRQNFTAQLIFRDMGFYLSLDELKSFSYQVIEGLAQSLCNDCPHKGHCRSLLLKTPSSKIDIAISRTELLDLQDLIDNVIIRMDTKKYMSFALN